MAAAEKEFVLKHVIKNVSSMEEEIHNWSDKEEHFGVPWCILVSLEKEHLGLYLCCLLAQNEKWSIQAEHELKILSVTGKVMSHKMSGSFDNSENLGLAWGWPDFVKWEAMMKDFVIDDTITAEIHVKITKMTGIEKKKLRNFDESGKNYSDVVLVVEDQKFYVSKLFLASQAEFFKNVVMKMRAIGCTEFPENILKDVKPEDFQNFLELLYGESPIDESTIDGILHLADMYVARVAIRKCEQFLIEISEKTLKEKLKLAHRYNLQKLKDHCLSKITSAADIRSILTYDPSEMDPSVVGALLQKSLSLLHSK